MFEGKKTQSRIPHPTNISFKNEGEIDIFRQKRANRIHHQQTWTTIRSKKSLQYEGNGTTWKMQIFKKQRAPQMVNIWVNTKEL